ncbi:MAG: Co2+/Mg2+ efflux protein ApaG [Saprospiraceae bacterium]|nr:Co2+/Mg2+ efflux protein ApaG [Saprospiraceae bacterium]MBP7679713.1 Co2+/Mg2+ efflux protein ApaG [Saprospiraceae bacterium]
MTTQITNGIKISVVSVYRPDYYNPTLLERYVFSYTVTIENHNTFPVQLLSRHWYIFDANVRHYEVQGEGVLGIKPIIAANGKHEYSSWCSLQAELGSMHGTYEMLCLHDSQLFNVAIPNFPLIAPYRLN